MTTRHWGYFKTAAFDQNRWRPGSASSRWSSRRRTRSTEATSTPTTTTTTSNHLWTRRRRVSSRKETRRRKAGKTSTDEAIIMLRYLRIRTRIFFPFLSRSGLFRPKQCSFVGVHFSSFFSEKIKKWQPAGLEPTTSWLRGMPSAAALITREDDMASNLSRGENEGKVTLSTVIIRHKRVNNLIYTKIWARMKGQITGTSVSECLNISCLE